MLQGCLCESSLELLLCVAESVSAGSKTDPQQIKADPTNKACGASVKMYLKGKKTFTVAVRVRTEG